MNPSGLDSFFNGIYTQYQKAYFELDPIEFLHNYSNPVDQEIVGFLSAALAIGRVELFKEALKLLFEKMTPTPSAYVRAFDPTRNQSDWNGFVYRFFKGPDIALLIWYLHQIYQTHPTLEAFFIKGHDASSETIEKGLTSFVERILSLETAPISATPPEKGSGIRHFLASPKDGSACKRLNLFLRWMVRKDPLDLGIWNSISPSQLIVPLDTHIARLSRCLGLTTRKSPGWPMALEITRILKQIDANDPVKFDFALCTVGKLNACPKDPNHAACASCPIAPHCLSLEK